MQYADRLKRLGTETAFEVLSRINQFPEERKKNVISFAIGEPDFNTPEHIQNISREQELKQLKKIILITRFQQEFQS